jgi:hypothetical protein
VGSSRTPTVQKASSLGTGNSFHFSPYQRGPFSVILRFLFAMPGITILPANLATLIVESFLYGLLLLLFISTIYFLATRRTLAGTSQTTKHHFKSVVFLGVTALFIVVTIVSPLYPTSSVAHERSIGAS